MESLVGEMGLAQFADHSLDRVVLAEGPTDAAVIRDLVGRWGCGSRVGVFSLGGSNLINGKSAAHLSEFLRVSERVMAVIDSERHSEGVQIERPRQEFERDCRAMGIRCHVLERRAMENYLADSAVKCKFGPKYRALGPYERLDEAPFSWGKEDNWRIAREMSECDWESTDVGASLKKFVEVETA